MVESIYAEYKITELTLSFAPSPSRIHKMYDTERGARDACDYDREVKNMKIKPLIFSVLFLLWPALLHAEGLGGIHISHLEPPVHSPAPLQKPAGRRRCLPIR